MEQERAAIRWAQDVDSTNRWAAREAERGAPSGTLFVADRQSAGRGRLGRSWDSGGKGLYMSLLLRPDDGFVDAISRMPLLGALMACEAVREAGVMGRIKWPNDIVVGAKKLCGVLCESSFVGDKAAWCVLGVGINLTQQVQDFDEAYRGHATSLLLETQAPPDRMAVIASFLRAGDAWYGACLAGEEAFFAAYRARSATLGQTVRVMQGEAGFIGVARDILADGALLVDTGEGTRAVYAGEVSVRGLMGYV